MLVTVPATSLFDQDPRIASACRGEESDRGHPSTARHDTSEITACRAESERVLVSLTALRTLAAWRRQRLESVDHGGESCLSRIQPASPPRIVSARRTELTRLWTVLPKEARQRTLRCLAKIVVGHLERREVHDDRS